ncbi:FGGY family carbohydrate kinase [Herbiconiux sp. VKM Ac-2851]|uniref:FGGY family carbohydrate kinase n=1 Tax=Herbiconiux sp. VKM Ac-2851 TaxID=2739025 RepID=UPI001566730D|nr:hypothetical protein [Herbiconiux sp. VKM Ac-2851]
MSTLRTPVSCGVDIGSTNAKVVALDRDGTVVARAVRRTPRDPEGLWIDGDALFAAVEEMVLEVCGLRFEVHAVCCAGVGEDGVLVDADRRPLTRALAWFDPRRGGIFRELAPLLDGEAGFDTEADPVRTLVGWSWARRQPGSGAASAWVALSDLPGVRWSGHPFISDTLASRTGAWRSLDRAWAMDRVDLTLGSGELLPAVVATGDTVGAFDSPGLRSAGVLATDAVVVAGGHDHPIGGWGVDQLVPGAVLDSMGTAEVVVAQAPGPVAVRPEAVDVAPGIRSHGTTLLRVEELSRNVEWAAQDPAVAHQLRALLEGGVAPLPLLEEGLFEPGRRGGGRPSYALGAPQDPLARASAVLGALACAGRDAVDAVREGLAGGREVRLAGGWVRSPGWVEIKTAVNGYRTAVILEPEVTAVGAALLAARARGWQPDPARALGGTQLAATFTSSGTTSVSTHVS